ncbi:MAG: helix-turn-helix transcriptional regulator, partial [Eubacterium sp.]|nr:helix-turn-helix transcriptional regulator [Eubacterium sp.]
MKRRKRELGYSFNKLSELSGVPVGTLQKIFSGETSSPRYNTIQAISEVL